jgi:hypothetical protein
MRFSQLSVVFFALVVIGFALLPVQKTFSNNANAAPASSCPSPSKDISNDTLPRRICSLFFDNSTASASHPY